MTMTVTLSRDLFVPRELVFDAWTQAQHVAAWYPPRKGALHDAHIELRRGGRYDLEWLDADDVPHSERGTLRELNRSHGFHWRMQADDAATRESTPDMNVHVTLEGEGGTCSIALRHEGLPSAQWRDRYQALWEARLERLAGYFSAI